MEDFNLPQSVMVLMAMVVIPWLVHLTRMSYKNQEAISINTVNDANVNREFQEIKESIEKMSSESRNSFDKIEKRLDQFIVQEISLLKGLIK